MGDVDASENFRGHIFSSQALGIGLLSSPTLRQRIDAKTIELFDVVPSMTETLPAGQWPAAGRPTALCRATACPFMLTP